MGVSGSIYSTADHFALENVWSLDEAGKNGFREEVRAPFLHEVGHYLGLNEDELMERGLEQALFDGLLDRFYKASKNN